MESLAKLSPSFVAEKQEKTPSARAACIFLLMIMTAFIGWAAENTVKLVTSGVIDNRYHVLPFIFPYGFAFLVMHLVLGDTDDIGFFGKKIFKKKSLGSKILSNLLYVFIVCLFVFLGELGVGNAYETLTGATLWDYSEMPLHLTKYVCLSSAFGYGIGAYAVMKFMFYPLLNQLWNYGNIKSIRIVDCTLGTLVVLDSLCMILVTLITKVPPVYWTIQF